MSRTRQTQQQFASWIRRGRWDALLYWFNQNNTRDEDWQTLQRQALALDYPEKWKHYVEFFQLHMNYKTQPDLIPIGSNPSMQAVPLLSVAMKAFFNTAVSTLDPVQRTAFGEVFFPLMLQWKPTWVPGSKTHLRFVEPYLSLAVAVGAFHEWDNIRPLLGKNDPAALIRCVRGENPMWANRLETVHLENGGTTREWHRILLDNDCVAHFPTDGTFPVARAVIDYGMTEAPLRKIAPDVFFMWMQRRYPYLRVWCEHARTEDAQACRALFDLPEIDQPRHHVAQSIGIGKNLGLPMEAFVDMLNPSFVQTLDVLGDGTLFEDPHP